MSGVLTLSNYIGGPDEIQWLQIFPSNQFAQVWDFHTDITGWTFTADHQTVVVDQLQFSRSGTPNFANSTIIGYFPKEEVTSTPPTIINQTEGKIKVYFPANMYQGPIIPDARKNVPITIFSLTFTNADTPAQVQSQRFALIQCYEPDVIMGDPIADPDFTSIV